MAPLCKFWLGLPLDMLRLLAAALGWLIVPPGVASTRFPWGHFLLRAVPLAAAWWWAFGGSYEGGAGTAVFCSACTGASLGIASLTASAMYADSRGRA